MDDQTMTALPPELLRAREYARYPGEHRATAALVHPQLRDASATGDGTYTFTGRAVVYDTWTTLYSGELFGDQMIVRERIAPGALTEVLAASPEVHLNHGHDMKTSMARLQVVGMAGDVSRGGLKLWEDGAGLNTFARLNPELSHVRDLKAQMDDGIIDQMSFAFQVGDETYDRYEQGPEGERTVVYDYTINRVSALYDVCACAQGAYPTTSAQMRSAVQALQRGHAGSDPVGHLLRHGESDLAGGLAVTDQGGPSAGLRAKARAARVLYPRR
jgi:HK97 family phage prohead protease